MILEYELLIRLIVSTSLGALIGLERETAHQPAGLRTHMMISLSACLITITSLYYFDFANADVSRIAAGVVMGIGFIGAGAIMNRKNDVKGLTTA
ncbi:MAG: MgtC/SapB family protein, partial [Candidatus Micrarchaeota archaeon]|nr:MgtC/SapB family protein [Candidatus Micrarchaeota archaeon]